MSHFEGNMDDFGMDTITLAGPLKAKLDASGHYDEFEIDRVVNVELDPKATQAQLVAGITPDDPAEYGELVCKLF